MDLSNIFNSGKLKAIIGPADAAANNGLIAAKITTLRVDGKDISALDAPLADKINALNSLIAAGAQTAPTADLIAENGAVAAKAEELAGKLAASEATARAQAQEISKLKSELAVSQASVQALTASGATNAHLLKSSNDEVARLSAAANVHKTALASRCLAAGCLELTDADGHLLKKEATAAERQEAAMRLSHEDLFKAYTGAVNAAMAKTGVSFAELPAAKPQAGNEKKLTWTERCVAGARKYAAQAPAAA